MTLLIELPTAPVAVRVAADAAAAVTEERAFRRGLEAGGRQALASAAGALMRAAEALDAERERAVALAAKDASVLAIEIARELLRVEIEAGRFDLETIVRETLQASGVGRGPCTLHLHPADMARLANVPFRAGTKLEADAALAPGDVHVETQRGLLVRELEQALAAIGERLQEELA